MLYIKQAAMRSWVYLMAQTSIKFPHYIELILLFKMQKQAEYFVVQQLSTIKANCHQFISQQERKWRAIQRFQQPPFQRIAKYQRNLDYHSQNVRTFKTLQKVFNYLIEKIFPLLLQQNLKPNQQYSIAIFIEQRLKAIRCELFVQGIICPKLVLRLIHANIIIEMMKEKAEINNELIGLQQLIDPNHQQIMMSQFPQEYQSALTIAILSISKQELQNLLLNHQMILQRADLCNTLMLRLKIERNNYYAFYRSLEQSKPIVKCLLFRRIQNFKQIFLEIIKKAFGDVPSLWLCKRLGLQQPEKQGWINLKQSKQCLKGAKKGFGVWIKIEELKYLLID